METQSVIPGTVVLLACLLTAVVTDLRSHRIPNVLIVTGVVCASLLHGLAIHGGVASLAGEGNWDSALGIVSGLALLMPLYVLRACGAGDVKLMALVGAFMGIKSILLTVVLTFIAGGVISLALIFSRGLGSHVFANLHGMWSSVVGQIGSEPSVRIDPIERTAFRLPYAVAIAIGTGAALALRLIYAV